MSLKLEKYPQQLFLSQIPEDIRPGFCQSEVIKPIFTLRSFDGQKNIFEVYSVQCLNPVCQDINCRLKKIINI